MNHILKCFNFKNSTFVAKKAKTFEEEKKVAEKAPVDGIQINDLNKKKKKKKKKKKNFHIQLKLLIFIIKIQQN
jgi:hypothetical protein